MYAPSTSWLPRSDPSVCMCLPPFPPTHSNSLRSGSSSGFALVRVRLVWLSLRCTATFIIYFHWSLLLAFSLYFSSASAFLRSLFTQSSHLSGGLPRFLQPSCFFVSDLFGNLSSFILTLCPAISSGSYLFCQLIILIIQLFSHTCSLC